MLTCEPRPKASVMIQTISPRPRLWLPRWTKFVRGDIYRLKSAKAVRGPAQTGARYAVVVQSDDLPLSTWIVAPTSTGRRAASFRREIEIDGLSTRVMVEQLSTTDVPVDRRCVVLRIVGST